MTTERIKYSAAAPWPANAAGTGLSLQRRVALEHGNDPVNWAAGTPTAGRATVLDSDGDGLPDAWEDQYGLDRNSPTDAALDGDNDGASNLAEYRAGTIPTDAGSVFAFVSVQRESNGVRLRFHAVQGRAYAVEASATPAAGGWQTVTNLPVTGVTGEREVLIPDALGSAPFFRMSTPVTP